MSQPDFKITVEGEYYTYTDVGRKSLKHYSEDFFLKDEHVPHGPLSLVVSGFPGSKDESLLYARLRSNDPMFRGVRTHRIVKTERLTKAKPSAAVANSVDLMDEHSLTEYVELNAFDVDLELYETIEEKRAAVAHYRRNAEEYTALEASLAAKIKPVRAKTQSLNELNQPPAPVELEEPEAETEDEVEEPKKKAAKGKKVQPLEL